MERVGGREEIREGGTEEKERGRGRRGVKME